MKRFDELTSKEMKEQHAETLEKEQESIKNEKIEKIAETVKRNASKSGTISSFKTLIANLENTGIANAEELEKLKEVNKTIRQRWIDSL